MKTPAAHSQGRPRIRGLVLSGVAIVLLGVGGSATWAGLAPLERGVLGKGRVAGISLTQTVQHLEGGIIRDIRVREGDRVRQGDVLIALDPTEASLRLRSLERRHAHLLAQEARLLALRTAADSMEITVELQAALSANPAMQEMVNTQHRLLEVERSVLERSHSVLDQRVRQQHALLGSLRERSRANQEEIELVEGRIADVEALVKKGYAPRTRLVELSREKATLAGTQAELSGRTAQTQEAINEIASQVAAFDYRNMERWSTEAAATSEEREQVFYELLNAREKLERSVVLAPVSGTVMNLRYVTAGGVVAPGDVLMEVVPTSDVHLVDVRIAPQDAEGLHPGQPARVRLSGLPQRSTPLLSGEVQRISPDTLVDEHSGLSYYDLRVEIDLEQIRATGLAESLQPGMPAEVVLVAEKSSVLQALLQPLSGALFRTLRQ